MKLKRTIVAPALVAGVALVSGGWLLQQGVSQNDSVYQRARIFDEVLHYVSARFVDPHPSSELYEMAVEGMLDQLGDPHTTFMSADEYRSLQIQTTGEYGGLGIQISERDGWITAMAILPGTPAERAGVRVGDRIVEIAGQATRGWTDDQAVKVLRGPKGSPIDVKIQRPGMDELIPFRIVRESIHVQSVPYAYLMPGNVGYVNLTVFSETSTDEIRAAVARLQRQGMKSLVLDLRGNPGGLLDQGVQVSDLFLPSGRSIVETRARDPRENETYSSSTPETYGDLPVIVLVDEYSASASEIVAGALQDHDRALVLGTTTYGKGSVQSLFPLSGGNVLKMTTAKWFTPSGRSIQKEERKGDAAATADTTIGGDGNPMVQDTAARKAYRTGGGRVVYGGGGIVPDLIVRPDTATEAEKEFFRAAAKGGSKFNNVLFRYSIEYARTHPQLRPDFTVTPEMRRAFFEGLRTEGVEVTWEQFQAATRFIDARMVDEIATAKFGRPVAAERDDAHDRALQEALRLARAAPNQAALFRAAQGARTAAGATPRS